MKGLSIYALLAANVSAAPQLYGRDAGDDTDCSMVWVTIYTDSASTANTGTTLPVSIGSSTGVETALPLTTSSAPAKIGGNAEDGTSDSKGTSSAGFVSASSQAQIPATSSSIASPNPSSPANKSSASDLNIPTRPDGTAPLPINDDHLSAPVATDPVPAGAATYTPTTPSEFDNLDFAAWMKKQKDDNLASKWLKVAPGTYRYKPGKAMPDGTDANTVEGENIAIGFTPGGWTLDLRGVTFYIDVTPENKNQRPDVMIYINQSEGYTILGGTVWVDQGEQWTQARVKSMSAPDADGNQIATIEVEQGYNVSAWRNAGPRNQGCVDDSNKDHYTRPDCNFWYVSKYDFSALDSKRTFTASVASRAGIKENYVISMILIINSYTIISTEWNGDFHVKGFTSNGAVMSIGLGDKSPPVFEDVWYVNPPPRPGFAPRVQGPALSWGNIGGPIYQPEGQKVASMPGSVWQTTGCVRDLQSSMNGSIKAE